MTNIMYSSSVCTRRSCRDYVISRDLLLQASVSITHRAAAAAAAAARVAAITVVVVLP